LNVVDRVQLSLTETGCARPPGAPDWLSTNIVTIRAALPAGARFPSMDMADPFGCS
jgi:hypothetical protein